jgi:septum formation protein
VTIVLASQSASRAQVLRAAGVQFDACAADIDEQAIKDRMLGEKAGAEAIALALATHKACAVSRAKPTDIVIGGDQVLWIDGELISKAPSIDAARTLLKRLRGRRHALVGGLVLARAGGSIWQHSSRAELTMRAFSDDFLEAYLAQEGEAVLASVGCYRLEGIGAQLFDAIDGDYFTILGLALVPLLAALRQEGALPQ